MKPVTIVFKINHPGEETAGIWPFTDKITITIESGNPPGNDEGEFCKELAEEFSEWYAGADVSYE